MRTYRVGGVLVGVLVVVVALAACGGGESRWAGTMSDSAGVTIVSNTDVGIWAPGEEWTFEEELRIGAREGAPEYELGQVGEGGVAVDSQGRIFVLDGQAEHIQAYSPDGVYERTVGARGSGPGELQMGMCLLMGPGDTLLVPDFRNRRFNRYAPDGSSAGGSRMELDEGWPMRFRATRSGVMAEQIRAIPSAGEPAGKGRSDALVRLATDGSRGDTLMTFPSGKLLTLDGRGHMYAPEPVWDLGDDALLVLGVNDEYRLGIYSGDRLKQVITKPFERRPVDDREKEAVWDDLERRWTEMGIPAESWPQMRSNIDFADFLPAFHSVRLGPRGTIWVQYVQPATELGEEEYAGEAGAPEWDVFDSEGRFLGTVTLPQRFTPVLFRDDRLYGTWRDELDVQYVLRLRILGDLDPGAM
jgi:hypothetical protein